MYWLQMILEILLSINHWYLNFDLYFAVDVDFILVHGIQYIKDQTLRFADYINLSN